MGIRSIAQHLAQNDNPSTTLITTTPALRSERQPQHHAQNDNPNMYHLSNNNLNTTATNDADEVQRDRDLTICVETGNVSTHHSATCLSYPPAFVSQFIGLKISQLKVLLQHEFGESGHEH